MTTAGRCLAGRVTAVISKLSASFELKAGDILYASIRIV
jgi:hypothetical protein